MQYAICKMQNAECTMQNTETRIQTTRNSKIRKFKYSEILKSEKFPISKFRKFNFFYFEKFKILKIQHEIIVIMNLCGLWIILKSVIMNLYGLWLSLNCFWHSLTFFDSVLEVLFAHSLKPGVENIHSLSAQDVGTL